MNKRVLTFTGMAITGGTAMAILIARKRKRQHETATELLKEVTRVISPTTSGLLAEKAFNIHYPQNIRQQAKGTTITLKKEVAEAYAHQLHNAWGKYWWQGDDEEKIYAVFRALQDKVQVAQVAKAYLVLYKTHLIDQFNDRLNEQEIKKVLEIIHALPPYRTRP